MGKTLVPHQQVKCQGQKCPTQKSVSHCISCSTWLPALLNIKDVELQKQTGITVWTSKSQLWEAGLAHKLPELSDLRTQHRNNPFLPLQQILRPSTPHFASRVSPRKQTQYLHCVSQHQDRREVSEVLTSGATFKGVPKNSAIKIVFQCLKYFKIEIMQKVKYEPSKISQFYTDRSLSLMFPFASAPGWLIGVLHLPTEGNWGAECYLHPQVQDSLLRVQASFPQWNCFTGGKSLLRVWGGWKLISLK